MLTIVVPIILIVISFTLILITYLGSGLDVSRAQDKGAGGPVGLPSLPTMQKIPGIQVRPTTSGSSRDLSDDDEVEGETETNDNMDPADAKRVRRLQII